MRAGHQTAWCIVTVTKSDGVRFSKRWTGTSARRIHKVARAHYLEYFPDCRVSFTRALYMNNYGAH